MGDFAYIEIANRAKVVIRPRLIKRLNDDLSEDHKPTLISAPTGFSKTLWSQMDRWISLDDGDNEPL